MAESGAEPMRVLMVGAGAVECAHVEHEEMITVLRTLHALGLDSTEPVTVTGVQVSPRDLVAACLPDPATIGPRMEGKPCAGRQRRLDARRRCPVRGVTDRDQPRGGPGAARRRHPVGRRRAGTRGVGVGSPGQDRGRVLPPLAIDDDLPSEGLDIFETACDRAVAGSQ